MSLGLIMDVEVERPALKVYTDLPYLQAKRGKAPRLAFAVQFF
jgi:hypothetical protein